MIYLISSVALLVREYTEAKDFYCQKLGFECIEDTPLETKRWVRLKPKGGLGPELLLSKAINEEQAQFVGNQAAGRVFLFMSTSSLDISYKLLSAKGVIFTELPRTEKYGKVAVFKDLYGNRIDLIEPNREVGSKDISKFIRGANRNSDVFFHMENPDSRSPKVICDVFNLIGENLTGVSPSWPKMFFDRLQAAYFAALRIASSGQAPETYPLLRACLENALYAYAVQNKRAAELWRNKDNNEVAKRDCRRAFQITRLLETFSLAEPNLANIFSHLYELTIDYGAHPNPLAHFGSMDVIKNERGNRPKNLLNVCSGFKAVCIYNKNSFTSRVTDTRHFQQDLS